MLDTLDDAFWMLPFSSKKQAQIVRQENDLTDDVWQRRRDQIMAEHRLDGARDQLRTQCMDQSRCLQGKQPSGTKSSGHPSDPGIR